MGHVPHGSNTRRHFAAKGQLLGTSRAASSIGTSDDTGECESESVFPVCVQTASHASPRAIVNARALSARVTRPAPSLAFNAALFAARIARITSGQQID